MVCSGDQREDNGGDNARLQPSELQEHQQVKFRNDFFNHILKHYRSFNVVGFTALNSLDNLFSNVLNSHCSLFNVIFYIHFFQASSVHFCLVILICKGKHPKTSYVLIFLIHLLIPVPAREIRLNNRVQKQILIEKFENIEWSPNITKHVQLTGSKSKKLVEHDDKMPSYDTVQVAFVCFVQMFQGKPVQLTFYNRTFFCSQSLFRRHFATDRTKRNTFTSK